MPTYQYACTECGHRFEEVQAFSDAALTVCPVCGGKLRKVYGSVGVVFKGSGFYRNDARESGKKSTPATDSSTKDATRSGEGGKAKESAPAAPAASPAPAATSTSTPAAGSSGGSAG